MVPKDRVKWNEIEIFLLKIFYDDWKIYFSYLYGKCAIMKYFKIQTILSKAFATKNFIKKIKPKSITQI